MFISLNLHIVSINTLNAFENSMSLSYGVHDNNNNNINLDR